MDPYGFIFPLISYRIIALKTARSAGYMQAVAKEAKLMGIVLTIILPPPA
jgi:hypothetical protein